MTTTRTAWRSSRLLTIAASLILMLAAFTPVVGAQEQPDAPRAGTINGTVTDETTGLPIEGVFVSASSVSGGGFFSGFTNADGEYLITPNNGEYTLQFDHFTENYIAEYHNNTTDRNRAKVVIVEAGSSQTIDAALRPGAEITGKISGGGGDLQFASVVVFNENFSFTASATTGADGRYRAVGLATGSYTVLFRPPFGSTLAPEYWENQPGRESAAFFDVTEGSVTNGVNAVLGNGGTISGRVRGSDAPGGLENISVSATRDDGITSFGDFFVSPSSVSTAADGTYTITGLTAGDWAVSFNDFGDTYVSEYYNNKTNFADANKVAVAAGANVGNINVTLARGGSITGTVTASGTGDPLPFASVWAFSDGGGFAGGTSTDTDGTYEINGLATGDYVVQFLFGSNSEYYDNKTSFANADRVAVTEGASTGGIDADLDATPGGIAAQQCDFNGDFYDDLAIGIPNEDLNGVKDAGMVNVIYGSAIGLDGKLVKSQRWSQELRGVKDDAEPNDHFGYALACGDFNGDRYSDLAVGVPDEDVDGVANAGAVNVIYGGPTGLTGRGDQIFTEALPSVKGEGETGDRFGYSLAAGDFNDDGRDDLAIGVPMEDVGNRRDAGEVHVLYGAERGLVPTGDQIWNQNSANIAGRAGGGDMFGFSLAAGDINGDRKADLAIGVPNENVATRTNAGAVNIIFAAWFQEGGLTSDRNQLVDQTESGLAERPEAGDNFGHAVAIADLDANGLGELIVGVPNESVGAKSQAGAVNVFHLSRFGPLDDPEVWTLDSKGVTGAAKPGDHFGSTLTVGDYDGDLIMDFSAGAPDGDVGPRLNAGFSMTFYGSSLGMKGGLAQQWHQNKPGVLQASQNDEFWGASLASGDFNGDGCWDVSHGVPGETVGPAIRAGMTNVLYGDGSGLQADDDQIWHQNRPGIGDRVENDDNFGSSQASSG